MTQTDKAAPKQARRTKAAETAPTPRAARAARRKTQTLGQAASTIGASADPTTPAAALAKAAPGGKLGLVVGLLRRPEGATVAQISEATDWLPHSVRGAMAGALKKKHKLTITSEPAEGGRVYRLAEPA